MGLLELGCVCYTLRGRFHECTYDFPIRSTCLLNLGHVLIRQFAVGSASVLKSVRSVSQVWC